jgi:hypothetical protein
MPVFYATVPKIMPILIVKPSKWPVGPGLQLSQRLTQSLVLSPQMQQSLALLQAPTMELKALVEQELQQNPVLEEVPSEDMDLREKSERDSDEIAAAPEAAEPPEDVIVDPATVEVAADGRWMIFRRNSTSWSKWIRTGAIILPRPTSPSASRPKTRSGGSSCLIRSRRKLRWRST